MGMDVFGKNDNYFRANIWQWRAILYVCELAGYDTPDSWGTNNGQGLDDQFDCEILADRLESYFKSLKTEIFLMPYQGKIENSPYQVDRDHLQEFLDFLRQCGGFNIH